MATSTPLQGKAKAPPRRTPTTAAGKVKGKPNGNIMSFFKRAESSAATTANVKEEDETLFLEDSPIKGGAAMPLQTPTPPREEPSDESTAEDGEMSIQNSPLSRYNEDAVPSKKRRTEDTLRQSSQINETKAAVAKGPFVDDSDSDDEPVNVPRLPTIETSIQVKEIDMVARDTSPVIEGQLSGKDPVDPAVPSLKRETTSIGEVNDFDGIEDFIDDEFPEEGEEYLERRWMEEQADFEEGLEEGPAMEDDTADVEAGNHRETAMAIPQDAGSTSCPICGGNTAGLTDEV